jgi:proteasome lid subunit RPN8/RPN11
MPDEILNKIKYLCKNIPDVEWSGILFYNIEGSIKEPSKMKITLEDILPMDMGSKAYTEYEIDNRYVDFLMEENQEHRMEWHMGHIHSHNTMPVFFSGTDMDELNDNSESHNIYLSLIVNNFMDFSAKVAFRGRAESITEKIPYHAKDEEGNEYIIDTANFNIKKEKMFVYDCDIVSKAEHISVGTDFSNQVKEIMKPKKVVKKTHTTTKKYGKHHQNRGNHKSVVAQRMSDKSQNNQAYHQFMNDYPFVDDDLLHPNITEDHNEIEIFAMALLNFTNELKPDDTIDSLISYIEEMEVNEQVLANTILEHLPALFEKYFPNFDEDGMVFISVVEQVIELFEQDVTIYPILNQTIETLKAMVTKFEEYGTATVQ